jgi:hypothetical protein
MELDVLPTILLFQSREMLIINQLIGVFLLLLIIGIIITRTSRAAIGEVYSQWNCLFDFQMSAQDFYKKVEEAILEMKVEEVKIKRIYFPQGGIFSDNRQYLRIYWKKIAFDICASPYGKGFFVSYWQGARRSFLSELVVSFPVLGKYLDKLRRNKTYYELDVIAMFNTTVKNAFDKVVDEVCTSKGSRLLNDAEKRAMFSTQLLR